MKKILFAIACMMMSVATFANNVCKISAEGIEAGKAGKGTLTLYLENDKSVSAFNFNLILPEGLSIANPSEDYDTTDRTWISKKDNWTLSVDDKDTHYLVIGYSIGTPMEPTDEDKSFMTLTVTVDESFEGGEITIDTYKFSYNGVSEPTTVESAIITGVKAANADEASVKAQKFMTKKGLVIAKGNKKYNAAAQEVK